MPDDQFGYKVHDKSREAGNLAAQLGAQWEAISGVLTAGVPAFNAHSMAGDITKAQVLENYDKGMDQLKKDAAAISDEEWENGKGVLDMGPAGKWEDTKSGMAWGFLFDAIHHRGQLTTYLRAMGATVPSIYGPSADTKQ
ncbi:MAG: DinB family protein [bacterium]